MPTIGGRRESRAIGRREALRYLTAVGTGLVAAGCTPARIALRLYPDEFHNDEALVRDVLGAFAETIVAAPGADPRWTTTLYGDTAVFTLIAVYWAFVTIGLPGSSIRRSAPA